MSLHAVKEALDEFCNAHGNACVRDGVECPFGRICDELTKIFEKAAEGSQKAERRLEAVKKIVDTALNNPRLKMETLEDEVAYLCSALKAIQMLFTEGAEEEAER